MSHEVICEYAILYRLWDGKLQVFDGCVIRIGDRYSNHCRFRRNNDKHEMLRVSDKSCEVYCDNVWMKEPNEKEARELLRENYRIRLAKHEADVARMIKYINILEKADS